MSSGPPRTATTASHSNNHHSPSLSSGSVNPIFIAMIEDILESDKLVFTTLGEEEMEDDDLIDKAFYDQGIRRAVKFTYDGRLQSLIINIEA
ncbi:hypothetical protein B9Z19DRAFT_1128607 [Tuber borchii]|uniref:Uncharacterized protein n=1 Tax=Tuber borchii TaxID=42251 RepID=A0A2T6ZP18_TUBBO|nr:hypothetical protein B9Z19DRAFT_1128607 [Tuber borchii]